MPVAPLSSADLRSSSSTHAPMERSSGRAGRGSGPSVEEGATGAGARAGVSFGAAGGAASRAQTLSKRGVKTFSMDAVEAEMAWSTASSVTSTMIGLIFGSNDAAQRAARA